MHALNRSRTRRSLTILIALGLALAGIIASRYGLLPHHGGSLAVYHHAAPGSRAIAMHYHGIISRMHYHG